MLAGINQFLENTRRSILDGISLGYSQDEARLFVDLDDISSLAYEGFSFHQGLAVKEGLSRKQVHYRWFGSDHYSLLMDYKRAGFTIQEAWQSIIRREFGEHTFDGLNEIQIEAILNGYSRDEVLGEVPVTSCIDDLRAISLSPIQIDIINAVKNRELPHLIRLIKSGVNVNAKDHLGRTALFYATALDQYQMVMHLLAAKAHALGASVEFNLFELIARYDSTQTLDTLIQLLPVSKDIDKFHADIRRLFLDIRIVMGQALCIAAEYGQDLVMQAILNKFPDSINHIDEKTGDTVLHYAAKNKRTNSAAAYFFVERGADIAVKNRLGMIPADYLLPRNSLRDLLVPECLLIEAVKKGNLTNFKRYINAVRNIDEFDDKGFSALYYAIRSGQIGMCIELLVRKACHLVSKHEDYYYNKILLEHKPIIDQLVKYFSDNQQQYTKLHWKVQRLFAGVDTKILPGSLDLKASADELELSASSIPKEALVLAESNTMCAGGFGLRRRFGAKRHSPRTPSPLAMFAQTDSESTRLLNP